MKTYPVYQATFSGSDDYMAHAVVRVAAVNSNQALKRFREWDAGKTGSQGMVGRLIYRHEEHGWCRPAEITTKHITKVPGLRTTDKNWSIYV